MIRNFLYDTILSKDDICNMKIEQRALKNAVKEKKKLVVYGPRNFGKTSILQSVVIPYFRKQHKESFVLNVDLMQVRTTDSLNARMKKAFELSFAESFPGQSIIDAVKKYLYMLRPVVDFDPLTGMPQVKLDLGAEPSMSDWVDILIRVRDEIGSIIPTLIVIDEFQEVSFVDGAEGLFRNVFQRINDVPIFLMGSKRHLLSKIFALPDAPLASFGEDVEFKPIEYKDYFEYMNERFLQRGMEISLENAKRLQDLMRRVPEAINIVCSEIFESKHEGEIAWDLITHSLVRAVKARRGRFERNLSLYTQSQAKVLIAIQKHGPIKQHSSQQFLRYAEVSNRTSSLIFEEFYNDSVIDKGEDGYYISDPLLDMYLKWYR